MRSRKRLCAVTGTRAEYGLLHPLLRRIADTPGFGLSLVATGMHLAPEFGLTVREIEQDGFAIDARVEMLLSSDSDVGTAKSMGLGVIGFADAFERLRPDGVLMLGDRFEMLAAASAALALRLPIIHLEGGHVTEGAIDDAIRHAITKMAHLHFTATEGYRRRIIQMGEPPDRVFAVGSTALDNILGSERLSKEDLERSLGFSFGQRSLLATFHPATLDRSVPLLDQMEALLRALDRFPDVQVLFTMPNADAGGRSLADAVRDYASTRAHRCKAVASLGRVRYVSALACVDAVVGNSSSGLIEAPSFKIGTVNIGDRQKGRERAASVIDCAPEVDAISEAISHVLSPAFRQQLRDLTNPFGDGRASERIVDLLREIDLSRLQPKRFFDLPEGPAGFTGTGRRRGETG